MASNGATTPVYFYVGRRAHPLYREQQAGVPPGFSYIPSHQGLLDETAIKDELAEQGRLSAGLTEATKTVAVAALGAAGHVRRVPIDVPSAARLLHSAQFLPRRSRVPYVVDFEDIHVVALYQPMAFRRPWARKRLLRALADGRCRFLLPWSEAAERGLYRVLGSAAGESVRERVRVVRPAIRPRSTEARERAGGPLRILFVGSAFLAKGGVEALQAVQLARATHDVELDMVSFVPEQTRLRWEGRPGIRLHHRLSADALGELYRRADAFLFASHTDTFGFVLLEALASGLPVISTDHFAIPEIVEHGTSGLLVARENSMYGDDCVGRFGLFLPAVPPPEFMAALEDPSEPYVRRIASSLTQLAEDADLHASLSRGALDSVRDGRLSMRHRQEQLADLYAEAVDG